MIRFQSQNLNDLPGSTHRNPLQGPMWQHGRCWLYIGKYVLKCCWALNWWWAAGVALEREEDDGWHVTLMLPPMFLSVGIDGPWRYRERRSIAFKYIPEDFYITWALWWNTDDWSRRDPLWRRGSFYIADFLLGRREYIERTIETRPVIVPMPERAYKGQATLFVSTWKRPRWFARHLTRVRVDMAEGEGIYEESWRMRTRVSDAIDRAGLPVEA